jgi:hypothetical protein
MRLSGLIAAGIVVYFGVLWLLGVRRRAVPVSRHRSPYNAGHPVNDWERARPRWSSFGACTTWIERLAGACSQSAPSTAFIAGHQEMIRVVRDDRGDAAPASGAAVLRADAARILWQKGTPPARLTRFREKYEALRRYGVERFVCLRFDSSLRSMSAEDFIGQVLVDALGARHIVVGHDFKFGRNMAGNIDLLRAAGPAAGFAVNEVPPFEIDGERRQQFADSAQRCRRGGPGAGHAAASGARTA